LLLRDEQWDRARTHRGDTDGDFGLGKCRNAIESDNQGSSDPNDKPKSAGHISPPSAQQSLRMWQTSGIEKRHNRGITHTGNGVAASNHFQGPGLIDRSLYAKLPTIAVRFDPRRQNSYGDIET
jgi:hypothetical protein